MPHVSTGDVLRGRGAASTSLGREAQESMDASALVPDELVVRMLEHRLARARCPAGALLDSFPRTLAQAAALDEMLGADAGRQSSGCSCWTSSEDEVVQAHLVARRAD